MTEEHCNHTWIYNGKSCCYRLKCSKCNRQTTAHYVNGRTPNIGEPVKLVGESPETIEVIGFIVTQEENFYGAGI